MSTYARYPVAFERGEGCRVWDSDGKEYLDFLSGIGVNNLGHCPPKVVEAIRQQAGSLIHTSNLYRIPGQERLAERLTESCFADQAFFCNSGAEANEAAIKLVRKYQRDNGRPGRFEIITTINSFHGRTITTLTASGQEKVQRGFDPLAPGFRYVPFGDIEAVEKAVSSYTAAILVEPIQGEAGVRVPPDGYLEALRRIADHHDLLLVFDEVQTGMGRTGRMWGHQWTKVAPDVMTIAKAIASGLPMGACLASARVAKTLSPGTHGSTFGGNPLCCAAANATLDMLLDDGVLEGAEEKGKRFEAGLRDIMERHKLVKEVRGRGLMLAMVLNAPAEEVAAISLSRGLLLNCTMGTILRFLPPLIVSDEEIERALTILDGVLTDLF
ncbi:MAG: acetylornithine transaminase [Magnetococcales bacterium]|nr:acetylornithine transaminase [Magnetococcales bacterium]